MRIDHRKCDQLRKVTVQTKYLKNAHGSCLITMGDTKVLCSATVEEKVPFFCKAEGKG